MIKRNILHFFRRYKYSIAFAVSLCLMFNIFLRDHINFVFSILNIAFIFTFLLLIDKVKVQPLRLILFSITTFTLSVSISFAVYFKAPLGLGNLASIFETNLGEVLSIGIGIYILALICLLTTTILSFKVINELKWMFSTKKVGLLLVMSIILINVSAVVIPVYRNTSFIEGYRKDLKELPLQTIYTYSSMRSPLLYGDVLALAVYSHEKLDYWRFKNVEKKEPKGVVYIKENEAVTTIYLVIGESAYRGRMSLYGYEDITSPFLDSIAKIKLVSINYYNAISIANITRDAVRFSLSFASPQCRNAFWEEKNIIELAKDAGYKTSWLSNQGQAGLYDNYPSYIAKSSDATYFESRLKKDDLGLVPILENYHEKGVKQLIALHLMGSHFPYNERYNEVDDLINLSNDYDKSIHHTDRFLKELYNHTRNKDESSIIIYFSDHGASPDRGVHGLDGADISEYEIPLVILQHNVTLNIDSIVSQYIDRHSCTINNLNLSYILAQLMGYSVDYKTVNKVVEQGRYIMKTNGKIVPFQKGITK